MGFLPLQGSLLSRVGYSNRAPSSHELVCDQLAVSLTDVLRSIILRDSWLDSPEPADPLEVYYLDSKDPPHDCFETLFNYAPASQENLKC